MSNSVKKLTSTSAKIPMWKCLAIAGVSTSLAFILFGGAHYIQNFHAVNSSLYHQEEDSSNWFVWLVFCFESGLLAGLAAFVVSIIAIVIVNRRTNDPD